MQWAVLVMLIVGVLIMELPMKPEKKKKEKDDGGKGTDGDARS